MKDRAPARTPYTAIANVGQVDTYTRTVPIIASTPDPVEGESIVSWDLERFLKNGVVLWAHDNTELPIGTATEVEFEPGVGLRMRVKFARAEANPLAEQIYQSVIDGIVRAVSVGYDLAEPQEVIEEEPAEGDDGAIMMRKKTRRTRQAKLLEVSFVPVGLDPNAGTALLNPEAADEDPAEPTDEEMKARISRAAADMARHRARVRRAATEAAGSAEPVKPSGVEAERTDAGEEVPDGCVLRMDRTPVRLDKAERTPAGGRRIPARLSRTGVLTYTNPDGTTRRELRLADEIFKADSLATLEDAPVIDIAHHTGMVTPKTWKESALGHVRGATRDGNFISGHLVVQHEDALDAIALGDRAEISLGYTCRLDMTPGEHEGQAYDCVQRQIRYNHAALCPTNRGRAGPEVGLRLDNRTPAWAVAHFKSMEDTTMLIRLDGKDLEYGSKEHVGALEAHHEAKTKAAEVKLATETAKVVDIQKRLDATEGERDTLKSTLDQFKADAAAEKKKGEDAVAERTKTERSAVRSKVRLVSEIARFFGDDEEGDAGDMLTCSKCGEKFASDEKKCPECGTPAAFSKKKSKRLDATGAEGDRFDALIDMDERDLMLTAIRKAQPKGFDEEFYKAKSADYVRSRYDSLLDEVRQQRGVDGVVRVAEQHVRRLDASGETTAPVEQARAERDAAYANAWKTNGQAPAK